MITLYGQHGSGSVAVEAVLKLVGEPFRLIEVATPDDPAADAGLGAVNPLRQLPTLVTDTGEVVTESAAILVWLADAHIDAALAPGPRDPARAGFLRWMAYVASAIYSLYWVRDIPSRLAQGAEAEAVIAARTAERIAFCWRAIDGQVRPAPYLCGDRLSVLDLYVAVISRWTPGRTRFYAEAPRLAEVVRRVDADPRLADLWAARFPFEPGWER